MYLIYSSLCIYTHIRYQQLFTCYNSSVLASTSAFSLLSSVRACYYPNSYAYIYHSPTLVAKIVLTNFTTTTYNTPYIYATEYTLPSGKISILSIYAAYLCTHQYTIYVVFYVLTTSLSVLSVELEVNYMKLDALDIITITTLFVLAFCGLRWAFVYKILRKVSDTCNCV